MTSLLLIDGPPELKEAASKRRTRWLFRLACEVKHFQDRCTLFEELLARALTWARQANVQNAFNPTRPRRHQDDAVAHVDGLVDVVGDEDHGGAAGLPQPQYFVLH